MKRGEYTYIWQRPDWPNWQYDLNDFLEPISEVRRVQGVLIGRLHDVGFKLQEEARVSAITDDVLKTSAIEGEILDVESVRSSVARHLGVDIGSILPTDRHIDGLVEMVLDATVNYSQPLTAERLFRWHFGLFPNGYSSLGKIEVAKWRSGPMQVVSGRFGKEKVHYEAPPARMINSEMNKFLKWFNASDPIPYSIKAALGHLWFVTLHPFDDGNGRIARAISDMLLSRDEDSSLRFYSLSAQIQRDRKDYYDILERIQKGTLDVTEWLLWFLKELQQAVHEANSILDRVLFKTRFWQARAGISLNERQLKVLNQMLDGFEGKLTTRKWASLTKTSTDTALRDINDLVNKGILKKLSAGGRSTSYDIIFD